MASLATLPHAARSIPVNDTQPITDDEAYAAFERRDRTWDGRTFGGVKTTGIYCRPSCPARRPKRDNVEFFPSAAAAASAGYRPCLRCLPDDVNREEVALEKAFRLVAASEDIRKRLHAARIHDWKDGVKKGVITQAEGEKLATAHDAVMKVIEVDDFAPEVLSPIYRKGADVHQFFQELGEQRAAS